MAGKGAVMNYLGKVAEEIGTETVELVEDSLPEAVESIETNVKVVTEEGENGFVDILVRTKEGLKNIYVEMKYSLPQEGEALERATKQVRGALNAGGEVILWTLKTPTAKELANFAVEGVTVLSGPANLFRYLFDYLSKN
jgi:hypothetical protein